MIIFINEDAAKTIVQYLQTQSINNLTESTILGLLNARDLLTDIPNNITPEDALYKAGEDMGLSEELLNEINAGECEYLSTIGGIVNLHNISFIDSLKNLFRPPKS